MSRSSIAAGLVLTCTLTILSVGDASAFCVQRAGGLHCSDEGHDEITADALSFLSDDLISLIVDKDTDQDFGASNDLPERHATNCLFAETAAYVNERYAASIAALDPSAPDSETSATHFGLLLHPIQDFYSHSSWVDAPPVGFGFDSGGGTLLESGLGPWQLPGPYQLLFPGDDIVLVEGLPPAGAHIDLPRDAAGNPTSTVAIVTIGGATFRGLMTASASPLDDGRGQCPESDFSLPGAPTGGDCTDAQSVCIRHGEGPGFISSGCEGPLFENCFHHDNPDHPLFVQAFNSAKLQTEHEWCRLLHSLEGGSGDFSRASIPMALWVAHDEPSSSPHPLGTACARDSGGPIEVEVKVVGMEGGTFEGSIDPFTRYNLSLVAYTGDFRNSKRRSVADFVGNEPELPADSMALCLKPTDTLVATAWGWTESTFDAFGFGEFDTDEDTIGGVTLSFTAASDFGASSLPDVPVVHHASSGDLSDVAFELTYRFVDTDADDLSRCGEASAGTDPSNPDTDGDGLLDGAEVNVHGTNPLVLDTDGDGLTDAVEVQGANPTNPVDADTDHDGLTDGTEDANLNGALDGGETNPNDADSDDDLLTDGCEVNGSNATDPLVADGDADGLLDGIEDANQNCALDAGETNPKDADSDDDQLNDGIEVDNGTNPLDSDSDDDGILDGDDVEWIQNAIASLPDRVLVGGGARTAMLAELDAVEQRVAKGQLASALKQLALLRVHVDGCGTVPSGDDWIVDCPTQVEVRAFLDLLVSNLQS